MVVPVKRGACIRVAVLIPGDREGGWITRKSLWIIPVLSKPSVGHLICSGYAGLKEIP